MNLVSLAKYGRYAFLAVLVATGGCSTNRYYAIVEHPKLAIADVKPLPSKPSVKVKFEFYSRGAFSPVVTTKWRPHVLEFVGNTGLFSQASPSDYSMTIQMDNVVDSVAGAVAQGAFSGLTLGVVGTKVTDNYVIKARLESDAGESLKKEYRYGITSTSGLIKGSVENVTGHKQIDDAFREVLDQFLLKWLIDLQKEGRFQLAQKSAP